MLNQSKLQKQMSLGYLATEIQVGTASGGHMIWKTHLPLVAAHTRVLIKMGSQSKLGENGKRKWPYGHLTGKGRLYTGSLIRKGTVRFFQNVPIKVGYPKIIKIDYVAVIPKNGGLVTQVAIQRERLI